MAQTTILASAQTAATSTDVTVAAGGVATVGMFAAAATAIPEGVELGVYADTPGGDMRIANLNNRTPVLVLSGPGTFRVVRPVISQFGVNVGAFSET